MKILLLYYLYYGPRLDMDSPVRTPLSRIDADSLTTPNQPIRRKKLCTGIKKERLRKRRRPSNENNNILRFNMPFFSDENNGISNSLRGALFDNDNSISDELPIKKMLFDDVAPISKPFTELGCALCMQNNGKGYIYCTRPNCENVVHENCIIEWRTQCNLKNKKVNCPFCRCTDLRL